MLRIGCGELAVLDIQTDVSASRSQTHSGQWSCLSGGDASQTSSLTIVFPQLAELLEHLLQSITGRGRGAMTARIFSMST